MKRPPAPPRLAPLARLSAATCARIQAVFTDIDDTLTTEGRLPAVALTALWALHDAGVAVVPVTGRPAGWCDHFARMWPVAGVIGENGAFSFRYLADQRRMVASYVLAEAERRSLQKRLALLARKILREVPGTALASDQPYRIHDLAVDYCEDVPPLGRAEVEHIVALFERAGATAKVSSIHVNGWFGQYDKLGMIRRFAAEALGLDLDRAADRRRALYVGDSPNDEPGFQFFEGSVGVANVRKFEDQLLDPPAFVTRAEGGRGFAELARHILRAPRPAKGETPKARAVQRKKAR